MVVEAAWTEIRGVIPFRFENGSCVVAFSLGIGRVKMVECASRLGKNSLRRARCATRSRPAGVFEHRSGAAIKAVSTGDQKTTFGWPAQ
jgi:hypothetical protein